MSRKEVEKALYGRSGNKYGVSTAEERTADGITFHSKREMLRYLDLKTLVRAGIIKDLELQPRFEIRVNEVRICTYVADFGYLDLGGRRVIEDVKGVRTREYAIKAKLFAACYPDLRIVEV